VFEEIAQFIRDKLIESGAPSLAVAVARDGEILWEQGFGWADREARIPATEHTMYSLASITKPITATALMLLVERGSIDLDRPANEYLGEAKLRAWLGHDDEATVRTIANHSSGLPLHYQFFYADEPAEPPPMDETIRRYGNLVTIPGEHYQYSNIGYGVLDYIIARVSGSSYVDFMRQEVFIPLGLTRTSVDIGPGLEDYAAVRYDKDGLPIPFYRFDHPGASAIYSSAHDLVRFGMFHLKRRLPEQRALLSDESIDAMQQPTSKSEEGVGYGIGWGMRADEHGYDTVSHSGGMAGVATLLTLVPSEKIAVAVLCNAGAPLPGPVTKEVLSVLLPAYGEKRREAEAAKKEQGDASAPSPEAFQPPPELLGDWKGAVHTYNGDVPFTLAFKDSGDVHAQLGDQLKTLVNDAALKNGRLTGRMMGDIGTEDAARYPYTLHLDLAVRTEALNGAVVAISNPRPRLGNALSHWAELKR
jgi:CubicO group peptidase (beta-lactamase class C family)